MTTNSAPNAPRTLTIDQIVSTHDTATMVCHGRITEQTASIFRTEVKKLAPGHQYVIADLSDVDFVDSTGLGEVLAAFLSAKSAGCELKLDNVHPRVQDLLNITRLASVFNDRSSRRAPAAN